MASWREENRCPGTENAHPVSVNTNRRKWVIGILGAIAVAAFLVSLTREREPSYQGKPLSYWVVQLCPMNPSSPHKPDAEEAVLQIGTNAIPYLLKWICYELPPSSLIRERAASIIDRMPRPVRNTIPSSIRDRIFGDWEFAKAFGAPEAFAVLGTNGAPAISALEQVLQDRSKTNTSILAMYCLSAMGTNAVPEIITRPQSSDSWQRNFAMEALYQYATTRNPTSLRFASPTDGMAVSGGSNAPDRSLSAPPR